MKIVRKEDQTITAEINKSELVILNNALNEICNGSYSIDEVEFGTLMGASRSEVLALLEQMSKVF